MILSEVPVLLKDLLKTLDDRCGLADGGSLPRQPQVLFPGADTHAQSAPNEAQVPIPGAEQCSSVAGVVERYG